VQSYIMDINSTDKKEKVVLCTYLGTYICLKKVEKTNFKLQSTERYKIRSSKIAEVERILGASGIYDVKTRC
jgi:hypothetical protein